MTDQPTNAFALLVKQAEGEAERQHDESERLKRERSRHVRWFNKLEAWALRQSNHELAQQFALARLEVFVHRRLARLQNEVKQLALAKHSDMEQRFRALDRQLSALAGQVERARSARKLGGKKKAERAGFSAKKVEVERAWAAYSKRGRGAKTRFTTDQAALHGVSPRTIEKWIGGK